MVETDIRLNTKSGLKPKFLLAVLRSLVATPCLMFAMRVGSQLGLPVLVRLKLDIAEYASAGIGLWIMSGLSAEAGIVTVVVPVVGVEPDEPEVGVEPVLLLPDDAPVLALLLPVILLLTGEPEGEPALELVLSPICGELSLLLFDPSVVPDVPPLVLPALELPFVLSVEVDWLVVSPTRDESGLSLSDA